MQEREAAKQASFAASKKGQPLAIEAPQEFEHKHGKPTKRMDKTELVKAEKEKD